MKNELRRSAWLLLAGLALATAWHSLRFVTTDVTVFAPIFRDKYEANLPVILIHAVSAITTLVIGPFLFLPLLYRRFTGSHGVLGRVYFTALHFAAITGFMMGTAAFGGALSRFSFCLMAVLWLLTGWMALGSILRRRVAAHRRWMIRNYALTFTAVTLRTYLSLGQAVGLEFETIYPIAAWLAWVPNVVVAEAIVMRGRRGKPASTSASRLIVPSEGARPAVPLRSG